MHQHKMSRNVHIRDFEIVRFLECTHHAGYNDENYFELSFKLRFLWSILMVYLTLNYIL